MAEYIPFVNSKGDITRFRKYYSDSISLRLTMDFINADETGILRGNDWWLDPAIDGYDHLLNSRRVSDKWKQYIRGFEGWDILSDINFIQKPVFDKVKSFIFAVLDKCAKTKPTWITVPQLPVIADSSRNMVNKQLAKATGEWRVQRGFKGNLIFPLIFTHQNQLKGRTQWGPKLNAASVAYRDSGADMIWTVDADLSDQTCREKHPKRFEVLIDLHEEIRKLVPNTKVIAGPYWGMNIVLWAKGLVDYPAVSLGTSYRYYISGAYIPMKGKPRVVLYPIRRWASATSQLRQWLDGALKKLSATDTAYKAFSELRNNLMNYINNEDAARDQVTRAYKEWFREICEVSPAGRKLALYQDLSAAFVIGKQLPILPKSEAPGREPSKVAEQLMLNCL